MRDTWRCTKAFYSSKVKSPEDSSFTLLAVGYIEKQIIPTVYSKVFKSARFQIISVLKMPSAQGAHTFLSFILDAINESLINVLKMNLARSCRDVLVWKVKEKTEV